jgi:hypothetical protein
MSDVEASTTTVPVFADALTLSAVGIIAYVLSTLIHEGLGHGGACLLSGGTVNVISTVNMECSADTRLVQAGGTLANFAAAALFFALQRLTPRSAPVLRFFCWLTMSINLLMATGYFLFSGIGGFGDWSDFIAGLGPKWPLRVALAVVGGLGYLLSARVSVLAMRPLIGSDPVQRIVRARRLMRIPYVVGGVLACIAGAFNPAGLYLVALSAAASTFGGTSALMWMHNLLRNQNRIPLGSELDPDPIGRSWPWIVVAAGLALVFIFVVGPGVRFARAAAS